jgi:hypothetical protein
MKKTLIILSLLLICLAGSAQTSFQNLESNYGTPALNEMSGSTISPLMVSNDEKQINRGDLIISGGASLYFRSYHYESEGFTSASKQIYLGIYPGVYFFVTDGLAIGASLTAGFGSGDGDFSYDLGIGPELRYYFDFGLFMKAKASYILNHYETAKYNSINIEPAIGYAIFLNPHVALEPCFFYNLNISNNDYPTSSSSSTTHLVGFEIGLSIFL